MKKVYVYTDGSYRDGVYSGAYLVFDGLYAIYSDAGCGTTASAIRNVAGELSAVMHACRWLERNNCVGIIVHDYEGISKWLTGEWRCKNDFTKQYYSYMKPRVDSGLVSFKWVRAHHGDLGNMHADKLARAALNKQWSWKL